MSINSQSPIYTAPQSQAHLTNILARFQRQIIDAVNDDIDVLESLSTPTATFTSNTTAGQLLYADGDGSVDLAIATSLATSKVIGMALNNVSAGADGLYMPVGSCLVASGLSLTPGAHYFLSTSVAGDVTVTPPSVAGQFLVMCGYSAEATRFSLCPSQPILL